MLGRVWEAVQVQGKCPCIGDAAAHTPAPCSGSQRVSVPRIICALLSVLIISHEVVSMPKTLTRTHTHTHTDTHTREGLALGTTVSVMGGTESLISRRTCCCLPLLRAEMITTDLSAAIHLERNRKDQGVVPAVASGLPYFWAS